MLILKPNLCQTSGCKQLRFSSETGVYNAITNENGWGTPNATIGNVDSAILTITRGDGNVYTIDIFTNTAGDFPTSDTTLVYAIVNEDIGYVTGEKIPDQIFTVKYTVTMVDSTVYTQTIIKAFTCNTKCCVDKQLIKIDWDCCDCAKIQLATWLQTYALYQGMCANGQCGNITEFNKKLTTLNKICSGVNGCGCI